MSEQPFTAGRWVLKPAAFRPTLFVMREGYTSDEAAVAEVIDKRYAALISAAPAMYEALKALRAAMAASRNDISVDDWIELVDAAISQAEASKKEVDR